MGFLSVVIDLSLAKLMFIFFSFQVYEATQSIGIHAVVIHQAKGRVTTWRVFDTYSTSQESKQLIDFVRSLREGRILCFAVKVRPPA